MAAWGLEFKPDTITSAFAQCSVCPLNPNVFTNPDFAPSVSYFTHCYVPSSYPPEFNGEEDDLKDDAIGSPLVGSNKAENTTDKDDTDLEDDKDTLFAHQSTSLSV